MIIDPKILHDEQWHGWKKDYEALSGAPRFKVILDIASSLNPKLILDMGCGSGYLAHLVKKINPQIIMHGFDISDVALAKADQLDLKYQFE